MKQTGYKGMLRDRCPKVVDYALKWCKAKGRWIEHTYSRFIKIYANKDNRNNATRIVLGIGEEKHREFDFDRSIDWDNITQEERDYWSRVSSWVTWFRTYYAYVEQTYRSSQDHNDDIMTTKIKIINGYLSKLLPEAEESEESKQIKYKYVDDLVDFLINCFENNI